MEAYSRSFKYFLCVISVTSLLLLSAASTAHELTTSIGLQTEYTDNSPRLPEDQEEEDTIVTPQITGDYLLEYPRLDARLTYTLSRREYTRDTFEDRTDVIGDADATWRILSDNLYWDFYQNNNRLTRESIEPDTPDNETERSIFNTGPRLQFPIGSTSRISLSARHARTTFDEEGATDGQDLTDSERNQVNLVYVNDLDSVSAFRIRLVHSDVEFDQEIFDYTQERVGIGFERNTRQWHYSLEAGHTNIDRRRRDSSSGVYAKITSRYQTATTSIGLTANRDLTDTATGLSLNENLIDRLRPGDSNFNRLDIVTRTRYELDLQWRVSARMQADLSAAHDRQDFETLPEDHERTSASLSIRYELTRQVFARIRIEGDEDQLRRGTTDETERNRKYRFDLGFDPGQRLNVTLWISKEYGDFDVVDRDYEELAAGFDINYQLWRSR